MSVWTFVINRILISSNTIMMKIKQALLVLCAFCAISSQNIKEVTNLRLSLQFLNTLQLSEPQNNILDAMVSDSVKLTVHFSVADTMDLQGITCVVMQNEQVVQEEFYFNYLSYAFDYDSDLFREELDFMTALGIQYYTDELQIRVKLHYTDYVTEFYSLLAIDN